MTFKETMEKVAGHSFDTNEALLTFAGEQWGLICSWLHNHEGELTGAYSITSVHRDDLRAEGFNGADFTDDDMLELADKMGEAYTADAFWIDLTTIAEEGLKKQRKAR
jgi:hypothetical protein